MTLKTCILCEHMRFDPGEPGYSEMTPGTDWASYCVKNHWSMNGYDVTEESYRYTLMTADKCPDFSPAPMPK